MTGRVKWQANMRSDGGEEKGGDERRQSKMQDKKIRKGHGKKGKIMQFKKFLKCETAA